MKDVCLILYSRKGCCLCEGLEQRIGSLALHQFCPPIDFRLIDIDDVNTSEIERTRYDLEVPVIILRSVKMGQMTQLPRVSPRLNGEALVRWLQQAITNFVGSY